MTKQQTKERIEKLRKEIDHHRYLYHVLDRQEISDAALDSLKHELYVLEQQHPDLITADSPTQRVGGEVRAQFQKVRHGSRMYSMEDVFTPEEFAAWYTRIGKLLGQATFDVFCMVKLDGLALSLVYNNGVLETAATRGDGTIGEDVTGNVRTIESVPLRLRDPDKKFQGRIEIRGEAYISKKDFEILNKEQKKNGQQLFANPRNTAAGAIRQLDPTMTISRRLSFFAWDIVTDIEQQTHQQEWKILPDLGFRVNSESHLAVQKEEIEKFWQQCGKKRQSLNYWIDGIVVRVSDNLSFESLGVVGKTPRGMVAWKFAAEEATTVIEDVQWFVGRTRTLTPVARVKPTWIGGTTVTHASLHNIDEIRRLDVRVGDTVIIYKAGDIIPKIKHVLAHVRPKDAKEIREPKKCPVCGSATERRSGEVALLC